MWEEKGTACSFRRNKTLLIEFNKGDSFEPEITVWAEMGSPPLCESTHLHDAIPDNTSVCVTY